MNYRIYRIAIGYFCIFALALLLSGLGMFMLKTGLGFSGVLEYYQSKSMLGLQELTHPHLAAMGIFIMVLGHFYIFTPKRKRVAPWFVLLFVLALLLLAAPFLILYGWPWAAGLKLAAVVLFVGLSLFWTLQLFRFAKQ